MLGKTSAAGDGSVGWRGASVDQNTCCASRGPEFKSPHPCTKPGMVACSLVVTVGRYRGRRTTGAC